MNEVGREQKKIIGTKAWADHLNSARAGSDRRDSEFEAVHLGALAGALDIGFAPKMAAGHKGKV